MHLVIHKEIWHRINAIITCRNFMIYFFEAYIGISKHHRKTHNDEYIYMDSKNMK
jgi:hypothetical protein